MNALRKLREARGLTQADLARRAGLHEVTISTLERRRLSVHWARLSRLADVLGVTTDAVLGRGDLPALTRDELSRKDRALLDAMKHHAEQLLGPQVLKLVGGWHQLAEMAWLGDLFRMRDDNPVCASRPPSEPGPAAPADWFTGWQSKRQIARAGR